MIEIENMTHRVVPSNGKYPGLTEICVDERCWAIMGTGEEIEAVLIEHINQDRGK